MRMSISNAFSSYIQDYVTFKGQSVKTQDSYVATMKHLVSYFEDIDIATLTFSDVRNWKLWLDKGRSPNTVRGYIICLRVVLKYLRAKDYPVINPDQIPTPKRLTTEVKYLTENEIKHLVTTISRHRRGYFLANRSRNIAIVQTLLATGLRNAEICSLNIDSIKRNTFTVIGKGGKLRICFISDEAIAAINNYLAYRTDTSDALFTTKTGKRITPNDIRRVFDILRRSYPEFNGVHPHTLRHTYATSMLRKRVDIRYVKEFMGHTDLNTTAHYTHLVNEDLRDIYLAAQAT